MILYIHNMCIYIYIYRLDRSMTSQKVYIPIVIIVHHALPVFT